MRVSVIVLAALAVVAQAVAAEKPPYLHPRLMSSAIRIGRLQHEIQELEHEIHEAEKIDPWGFILEMHDRLDDVEGKFSRKNKSKFTWKTTERHRN